MELTQLMKYSAYGYKLPINNFLFFSDVYLKLGTFDNGSKPPF